MRKNQRQRLRNQMVRSRARTMVKKARHLIRAGQEPEAREAVRAAYSVLDKAAKKGVIHKNNAARSKSRLMRMLDRNFKVQ